MNVTQEQIDNLERKYHQLMIDRGFCERRRNLKKLDRIDVRGICEMPENKHEFPEDIIGISAEMLQEYIIAESETENLFHCILPCFSEGILQLNSNLEMYWKILETNPEEQTEDVELRTYTDEGYGWHMPVAYHCRITAPQKPFVIDSIISEQNADVKRIPWEEGVYGVGYEFNIIPASELQWSKSDTELWMKHIQSINIYTTEERNEQQVYNGQTWIALILAVNILLWARTKNKGVKGKGWNRVPQNAVADTDTTLPKRSVRTVGGVVITSEKTPRCITPAGARHYKIAAWKRRAHPRHYKNGKIVWIKESTIHRKNTKLQETEPLPVTLKMGL